MGHISTKIEFAVENDLLIGYTRKGIWMGVDHDS